MQLIKSTLHKLHPKQNTHQVAHISIHTHPYTPLHPPHAPSQGTGRSAGAWPGAAAAGSGAAPTPSWPETRPMPCPPTRRRERAPRRGAAGRGRARGLVGGWVGWVVEEWVVDECEYEYICVCSSQLKTTTTKHPPQAQPHHTTHNHRRTCIHRPLHPRYPGGHISPPCSPPPRQALGQRGAHAAPQEGAEVVHPLVRGRRGRCGGLVLVGGAAVSVCVWGVGVLEVERPSRLIYGLALSVCGIHPPLQTLPTPERPTGRRPKSRPPRPRWTPTPNPCPY